MNKTMKLYKVVFTPEDLAYKDYKEVHYTLDLHYARQLLFDMQKNFRAIMGFKAIDTPKFITSIYEITVEVVGEKELKDEDEIKSTYDYILLQDNRERF